MNIKFILVTFSLSILCITSAFSISRYIEYRYQSPVVNLPIENTGMINNKNKRFSNEDILKNNPFKLKVEENKPAQESVQDIKSETTIATPSDKLSALGYVDDQGRILALVKLNNDVKVFSSEKEVEGYIIDYVDNNTIFVSKGGKVYELKLEKDNTIIRNSVKKLPTPNPSSNKTNNYKINRQEIEKQLKDINSLIRTVFISPYYNNNEFIGYRISRMTRDSILRKIGINPGDVIVRINGDSVENPQRMMELLSKISDVTAVSIDILRRGQKQSVFVEIQ